MIVPKPSLRLRKSPLVVFSPSGKYLAQVTVRVIVWDLQAQRVASQFKQLSNESYLCFSPDDRVLAVKNTNGELAFCDPLSGALLSRTGRYGGYREGCRPAMSADGTHLIDGDWNGVLRLVDARSATDSESHHFGYGYMFVGIAAHRPTGRFVAALNAKHDTRGGSKLLLYGPGQPLRNPTYVVPTLECHTVEGGWRHIDKLAMHPSGLAVVLALSGRTAEEPNCIAVASIDGSREFSIPLPSRMHFVHGLAWSQGGIICAAIHENIYRQGMASSEWMALCKQNTYTHVHFYEDTSLAQVAVWPWRDAWEVEFEPSGLGLAIGASGGSAAYFANSLLPTRATSVL